MHIIQSYVRGPLKSPPPQLTLPFLLVFICASIKQFYSDSTCTFWSGKSCGCWTLPERTFSRKQNSVRGSPGQCPQGFSRRISIGWFHSLSSWEQSLNTGSWNVFKKITIIPRLGWVARPEPGGKQIISTEGHPSPLTDAPLKKNRQGEKKSLPKDLQHQFCCKIQSHVCDL